MALALFLDREGRVREACRNPLTLIGRDICASHIYEVWDLIPKYIIEEIQKGQGVGLRIPGLVSFHCKTVSYCDYPQHFTIDKRLHMLISEDLVNTFGLKANRPIYGMPPTRNLNYAQITRDLNMPRYAVDACINEVIHAFRRALVTYRCVKFVFEEIGTLTVTDNQVTYSFDSDFLKVNGFGSRMVHYKTRFPCVCGPRPATPRRHYHYEYECDENEGEGEGGVEEGEPTVEERQNSITPTFGERQNSLKATVEERQNSITPIFEIRQNSLEPTVEERQNSLEPNVGERKNSSPVDDEDDEE